jgi:hypothetical protein
MGTTEEGAIDPMEEIHKLKLQYEKKGLTFRFNLIIASNSYYYIFVLLFDIASQ